MYQSFSPRFSRWTGEGVQGGPLQVGDGPHESDKMLELSNQNLKTAPYKYFLQCPIINYYLLGLGEQGEGGRGGPL
jgi:hypothetical protein